MTIRLLPKTQCVAIITLEKNSTTTLEKFIDQLRFAKQRNLLPENLHISNKLRRLSVVKPLNARQQKISIMEEKKIANQKIQKHRMKRNKRNLPISTYYSNESSQRRLRSNEMRRQTLCVEIPS